MMYLLCFHRLPIPISFFFFLKLVDLALHSKLSQKMNPQGEREGRVLGILGNWGFGYPGFGVGAYGRLLCRKKLFNPLGRRCRPGLNGPVGQSSPIF